MEPTKEEIERRNRFEAGIDYLKTVNEGAVQFALIALKTIILLNGAAAIAVLAYMGQIWKGVGPQPLILIDLSAVLSSLVIGVLAGGLATAFGYLRMFLEGRHHVIYIDTGRVEKLNFGMASGFQYSAFVLVAYAYYRFGEAMWAASKVFGA